MYRFFIRHRLLILAVICLATAIYVLDPNHITQINKPNTQSFTNNLHSKERDAERYIDSLMNYVVNGNLDSYTQRNAQRFDRLCQNKGISFYVYQGKRLMFWTNNSTDLPTSAFWFSKPLVKCSNCYVESIYSTQDNYSVVATIDIKRVFQYENQFLRNEFHPSFELNDNIDIVEGSADDNDAVFNRNGDYLFSFSFNSNDNTTQKRMVVYPLLTIAVLLILLYMQQGIRRNRMSNHRFFFLVALALSCRFALQFWLPLSLYLQIPIFRPEIYASSILFPSLGDLLITSALVAYLVFVYYFKVHMLRINRFSHLRLFNNAFVWLLTLALVFFSANYITTTLVHDSSFQLENYSIIGMSSFNWVGNVVVALWFVSFAFLLDKSAIQQLKFYNFGKIALGIILFCFIATVTWWAVWPQTFDFYACITFACILLTWTYMRSRNAIGYSTMVIAIAMFSMYSTLLMHHETEERKDANSKVIAVNLAQAQDPTAELVLADVLTQIKTDTTLAKLLRPANYDIDLVRRHMQNTYFVGYLTRYNFNLNICKPNDMIDGQSAVSYYNRFVRNNTQQTQVAGLYRINDLAKGSYYVRSQIPLGKHQGFATLFIGLSVKVNYDVLGYPELLLEKPSNFTPYISSCSYAKYMNNKLISHAGAYEYPFEKLINTNNKEFATVETNGYKHLIYQSDSNNSTVVSTPITTKFDLLVAFTSIFIFLLIIISLMAIFSNPYTKLFDIRFSIRNKIMISIVAILILSGVVIVLSVGYYTINNFRRTQNEVLTSNLHSVLVELEQKYANTNNIARISESELNSTLASYANIFFADINLYDRAGDLVATSRKEIFTRQLTSRKMHPIAYHELATNRRPQFLHPEKIGKLEYYSAYAPLRNQNNKLLGYLNVPYFAKNKSLQQELINITVTVINIYLVLMMVSVLLAVLLASRITRPLLEVQQRIREIGLQKSNQRVEYHGDDEVAELVNEYNIMLEELSISAAKLAKSEREGAWREMARQIAHEIKNPLTPMKLSIQLLERSRANNDPDFEQRFEHTANTIIEQIDSLTTIANTFSQFAKMSEGKQETVDLVERISQSVDTYQSTPNTTIIFNKPNSAVLIQADKERMLQVFNNLIKNATQAIPKNRKGKIIITMRNMKGRATVEIKDNGCGINAETEKKLFQPNFTTKKSGTGLGLAIVKAIVSEAGGAIWFYSKPGRGTSFFVSFPLLNVANVDLAEQNEN